MFRSLFLFSLISLSLFAEPTMEYIEKHALPMWNAHTLPHGVLKQVQEYKVFSIGEIHGTNEAPAFTFALLRQLEKTGKTILVGLEIPTDEQGTLDQFIENGDLAKLKASPFFQREIQDGRSSYAMADLLNNIRSIANVRVVGFDTTNASGDQERDEKMAANLTALYNKAPTDYIVFLAGNIHASISVGTPFNAKFRPMGYELLHQKDSPFSEESFLSIKVRNETGESWACVGSPKMECKVHPMHFGLTNYSLAIPDDYYFVKESKLYEGYRATFFSRTLSSSQPFKNK